MRSPATTATGGEALIVKVDGAVTGNRESDKRSYAKPMVLNWRSTFNLAMRPTWMWRTLIAGA